MFSLKFLRRPECWAAGHQWLVLRSEWTPGHLRFDYPHMGIDEVCKRCGKTYRGYTRLVKLRDEEEYHWMLRDLLDAEEVAKKVFLKRAYKDLGFVTVWRGDDEDNEEKTKETSGGRVPTEPGSTV